MERYFAKAKAKQALAIAEETSPFTIEVRFLGGLTESQKNAFKGAADRWSQIITGDLPSVLVDGEVIDDILILAQGVEIDGPGKILGQAGPTHLRPETAGAFAFIPAKGIMSFDTADLSQMEQNGTLEDVIVHEMGHVLGIGTIWGMKNLLQDVGTTNPTFIGTSAMEEYGKLRQAPENASPVPIENTGGMGTRDSHWRETVFYNELMSGYISTGGNPISGVTVGSLQDLGYTVDINAAEPFELPNLMALAVDGFLMEHQAPIDAGIMLPFIPIVLPEENVH